jgi:hypothetical protein
MLSWTATAQSEALDKFMLTVGKNAILVFANER